MTDNNTPETATLNHYAAGHLSWREACKALNLWTYDDLTTLLKSHNIEHPMPSRPHESINPLLEQLITTATKQTS